MALTLQARAEGLYTHGLGGIKYDEVAQYLSIDTQRYDVVMGFALGRAVDVSALSDEQRSREIPNGRMSLAEIWQSHS
jgi:nitroreductase